MGGSRLAYLVAIAGSVGGSFLALADRPITTRLAVAAFWFIFFMAVGVSFGQHIENSLQNLEHSVGHVHPAKKATLVVGLFLIAGTTTLVGFGTARLPDAISQSTKSVNPKPSAHPATQTNPSSDSPELAWQTANGVSLAVPRCDTNGALKIKVAVRNNGTDPLSIYAGDTSPLRLLVLYSSGPSERFTTYAQKIVYNGKNVWMVSPTENGVRLYSAHQTDWPLISLAPGKTYYDPSVGKGDLLYPLPGQGTMTILGLAYIRESDGKILVVAPVDTSTTYQPATKF